MDKDGLGETFLGNVSSERWPTIHYGVSALVFSFKRCKTAELYKLVFRVENCVDEEREIITWKSEKRIMHVQSLGLFKYPLILPFLSIFSPAKKFFKQRKLL